MKVELQVHSRKVKKRYVWRKFYERYVYKANDDKEEEKGNDEIKRIHLEMDSLEQTEQESDPIK